MLKGARLFVDPRSSSMLALQRTRTKDPHSAQILERIAKQPQARWAGCWDGVSLEALREYLRSAHAAERFPVLVLYNIPDRDVAATREVTV